MSFAWRIFLFFNQSLYCEPPLHSAASERDNKWHLSFCSELFFSIFFSELSCIKCPWQIPDDFRWFFQMNFYKSVYRYYREGLAFRLTLIVCVHILRDFRLALLCATKSHILVAVDLIYWLIYEFKSLVIKWHESIHQQHYMMNVVWSVDDTTSQVLANQVLANHNSSCKSKKKKIPVEIETRASSAANWLV